MESIVRWSDEKRFEGTSGSGHKVALDGDAAHTAGASPMEIVLMGLCGCTAIDVINILRKKREPLTSLTVSATAEQAKEPPNVFTSVKLTYHVGGAVSEKAVEDAVRLSETKYCSVAAMIAHTAAIEYSIEYVKQ
jgi:putative redox protein